MNSYKITYTESKGLSAYSPKATKSIIINAFDAEDAKTIAQAEIVSNTSVTWIKDVSLEQKYL